MTKKRLASKKAQQYSIKSVDVDDVLMKIDLDKISDSVQKKNIGVFEQRTYDTLDQFLRNKQSHLVFVDQQGTIEDIIKYIEEWFRKHKKEYNRYYKELKDYVYVNNFDNLRAPILLELRPGSALEFKNDIKNVVEAVEALSENWLDILFVDDSLREAEKELAEYNESVKKKIDDVCKQEQVQISFKTSKSGELDIFYSSPISESDISSKKRIERLTPKINMILADYKINRDNYISRIEFIKKAIANGYATDLFKDLRTKYSYNDKILKYFDSCIKVIEKCLYQNESKQFSAPADPSGLFEMFFNENELKKRINSLIPVIVSSNEKVPIVYEQALGVGHLIGSEKKVLKYGMMDSDLQYITPGIFHKANGGILLINIVDLLTYPWTYEILFKILKSNKVQIESLNSWLGLEQTVSLEPEPLPLNVKVILYFPALWMFQEMNSYDYDFHEIFSDSYTSISRNVVYLDTKNKKKYVDNLNYLAQFIKGIAEKYNLTLDKEAIAATIRYMAILSDSKKAIQLNTRIIGKLNRLFSDISSRSVKPTAEEIKNTHLKFTKGIDAKERNVADMFFDTMLLDMNGKEVGVSTGLSVAEYDQDIRVCYPMRITSVVSFGSKGLTFLENESGHALNIMKKSFYIISQWLKANYAQDIPIYAEIGTSIEQNYSPLDGDSATVAMLVSIISSISKIPVYRKFAITGSMDQLGNVQPIGALMTKIRGYWLLGRQKGLKSIDIIFPEKNISDLIVVDPVMQKDIEKGRLKLYPISNIKEALELSMNTTMEEIDKKVLERLVRYLAVQKDINKKLSVD